MSATSGKGPVFDPGLCRCCGSMRKCRVLNIEYDSQGQKEVYSNMLMDCFGLLISYLEGKPTERLICAVCVNRLRDAYNFRQQVIACEETFLQMKMESMEHKVVMVQIEGEPAKNSQEIDTEVKIEKEESESGSPFHDTLEDSHHNYDDPDDDDDIPLVHCLKSKKEKLTSSETDNKSEKVNKAGQSTSKKSKLSQSIKGQKRLKCADGGKPQKRPKTPDSIKQQKRMQLEPAFVMRQKTRPMMGTLKLKRVERLPMPKLQQLMRERDPSYMAETNILTLVEFSYICPFKCRHNHILCYYCGEHFLDPSQLREHTESEHNPKKFKIIEHKKMIKMDITRIDCRLCTEKIDDIEQFKKHISSVHEKKYFFDFKDLLLPFRLTKDELKCALCVEVFPYFHALNKHMNKHFRNYVCETCGLGFVDNARFMMHQARHEEGDFPCETCGKIFKAQYNRELHIDRVHNKRGRVYCPKCDVKLMSYYQKCKHLIEVHGEQPMSFPCNMCDKVYATRRMITIHLRKEHLKDFRYECHYCSQKFFTRFALNNHMPVHTGERNFKCKVCEKTYPRLKTLKDHMRIHTNDRRYRCQICGQGFIQNCSLKGHMKSQHPEYV